MIDEYEEIRQLRVHWSTGIIIRDRIFSSVLLALLALPASQLSNLFEFTFSFEFLAIVGIFLLVAALYWRLLNHNVDKQIVGLYGRMLQLEKQRGWEIHTKYYYSNLRKEYRKKICQDLGLDANDCEKFEKFKKKAAEKSKKHYDLLINVWEEYEHESVGSRGHWIHDVFAVIFVGLYWSATLFAKYLGIFG